MIKKMQVKYGRLTLLLLLALSQLAQGQTGFVQRKGHQFQLNGKPYYYIGANYWYGSKLGSTAAGKKRLQKELQFLATKGVTNIRVMVGAEGSGQINGVQRVQPPLQTAKGKFDTTVLQGLDYLLAQLHQRNMKAVLFLSNNWEWTGGFLQYLNWNGLLSDSMLQRKLTWDENRDLVSQFYTCQSCIDDYLTQMNLVVNRINSISGIAYKNEPAIMAWEIANEPRPMRPHAIEPYKAFISKVAAHIKKADATHLVTTGAEGDMGTENMETYKAIHADNNIDYLTIHIWPKNWGWFKDTAIAAGFTTVLNNTTDYIQRHAETANQLNKPLVMEEFGLPRDAHAFSSSSTTYFRDALYRLFLDSWQKSKLANNAIAGCNFWAFGGTARPIPGQIFWKPGDAPMGDPPMEEQGLNTVFDSDNSTWKLIVNYTKPKTAQQ